MEYIDVTEIYSDKKYYRIKKQKYYIDEFGNKYNVDGKHVILKPTKREIEVAKILGRIYGGKVRLIPVVLKPKGIKTPDYLVNNEKFDLKEPKGGAKTTIYDLFKHKSKQADNFIIDIYKSKLNRESSIRQAQNIFYSKHRKWIKTIILMDNNIILKILIRR